MSNAQLLVTGEDIAGAPVEKLLATARALVSEAVDKVRAGTSGTSREALVDQVVACQQLQSSTWAAQSVRLAQVAAIEEVAVPGQAPREVRHAIGSHADEWLPQELGVRLGWSDRQTTNRLSEAVGAIRTVPRLFERAVDGSLDPRKLNIVADALCGVRPKVARKVEGRLLAAIDDAQASNDEGDQPVSMTSTKLVRRTRRLLADLAPADAACAAKRSRANAKSVRAYPHHEPGLTAFHAILPTEDAMRIMSGINELARQLHKDTTTGKSLDECRVDAFIDLMLRNISVSTTCIFQIPVLPTENGSPAAGPVPGAAVTDFGQPQPSGSWVEAELADLLRSAAEDGLDTLTRLDTPTMNLEIRTPCDADADPEALVAAGSRLAPRVEIRYGSGDSSCPQRYDRPAGTSRKRRRRASRLDLDKLGHPDKRGQLDKLGDRTSTGSATERGSGGAFRVSDAVVEGLGVIPAGALTAMCRALGVKLTRALVNVKTGATVETSDITYRPGARLRRFVVTRDQHCRFPGVRRAGPARRRRSRHSLARRTDRGLEPPMSLPTPSSSQARRRLAGLDDTGRRVHLDQPVRASIRHPSGRLIEAAPWPSTKSTTVAGLRCAEHLDLHQRDGGLVGTHVDPDNVPIPNASSDG